MSEDYVMVCAIDLGTSYSGYAFCFSATPEKIEINKNWGAPYGLQSTKAPTSVLVDEEDCKDFGYGAERTFFGAAEKASRKNLSLYKHFKMMLYENKELSGRSIIESLNKGATQPAINVFSHALRYLKKHMMTAVLKVTATEPKSNMIRWVITVPAIWTEKAKSFMRRAALQAGIITWIDSDQLVIALEPEAASLYCRQLSLDQFAESGMCTSAQFNPGTKYLVLDAGGGTVDVTVHQVLASGGLRELHAATGGAWGGTQVDKNFENLLARVLGSSFINRYKKDHPENYLMLMNEFEKMKKGTCPDGESSIHIQLSMHIAESYSTITGGLDIKKTLNKDSKVTGVSYSNGLVIINDKATKELFDPVIRKILDHVEELLTFRNIHPCKFILLVGGFSECAFLQIAFMEKFSGRATVLIPSEAQMSVVKGAVLFGFKPTEIESRVMRYTYGCDCSQPFRDGYHDESKSVLDEGGIKRCKDVMSVFVKQQEEVDTFSKRKFVYGSATASQTKARFNFYAINRKPNYPQYTTEGDVESIGSGIIIKMPDTTGGISRKMELELTFGGTEIKVDGYDQTSGMRSEGCISFLKD